MAKKRSGGGLTAPQQAAKFIGISVLAGAVLAGMALPAAGALGLAAKGSVEGFDEIPANLKRPPLSQKTTILDAQGGLIASVYSRDRTVVPLDDISPFMRKAIVAIEDARFYEHGAIDLKGILRALNRNAQEGGVSEGASTLTQQYVKNVFVEEAGDDPTKVAQATQQTLGRKIKELKYAIQVEEELGKEKILENYLNITFFGQQAYGVEAAAQRYFSKPAKELALDEAALLAGIVQSPSRYDPVNDPLEATKRRNIVLQRMAELGAVTPEEAAAAQKKPLQLKVSRPKNGCITATKGAGFFCDYVRKVFLQDPVFGKTKEARAKRWNQGGMTIRTTLDPQAQASVQDSITKHVNQSDRVATAVTLVQPGTGKILAMGQSRPYGFGENETQINLSVDKKMGGSNFGFQVGSTFKPFTAAAALEQGVPASKSYPSPNKMPYPSPVKTCEGTWRNGGDTVQNETRDEVGPYNLREATAKSINTYFVSMISEIGVCPVTKLAESMNVRMGNGAALPQAPSVTLGSATIAPLAMANAYATFANRGTYCTPIAVESVTDADGRTVEVPKTGCKRVMSESTADTMNTLLRGVVEDGTGAQAGLDGRDSAGKTGTTDGRLAAWFVGYTPNMAGAVWVGGPGNTKVPMENITIGGRYHAKVFGGGVPGPIWRDAMSGALKDKPADTFSTVPIAGGQGGSGAADNGRVDNRPPRRGNNGNGGGGGGGNQGGFIGGGGGGPAWPAITLPDGLLGGGTGRR
ncbi:transglycosylase domain-containing protein [Streptomyces sp. URMC 123]|uniref:transglycosylase domain-containing protein n=1 Tax=Streptomyces sp. URMC 123 TaxID=3423403 RepID=UPI003F1C70FD